MHTTTPPWQILLLVSCRVRTHRVDVARDVEAELSVQCPGQGVRQEAVAQAEGPGLIDLGVEGWMDGWMLCR